ncbi:MAG: hypothetical protein QG635_869 [Bacteroidota bacterium]|nr:hypothetical protein [Bacteroidota bacterium]
MKDFSNIKELIKNLGIELLPQITVTLFIIFCLWLIRLLVLKFVYRKSSDPITRFKWRKISLYIVFLFGIITIGRVWFEAFQSVVTFIGLLSAGIAIALKDPIVNFFGWIFIVWRRPFNIGDRIQIGAHAGDVIDIRVFQFSLMEIGNWVQADQYTGRMLHHPNGMVFTQVQVNYSKDFQYIWNEISTLITFESNWKKAKTILEDIVLSQAEKLNPETVKKLEKTFNKYVIFDTNFAPAVYTSIRDSGVQFTIRYFCKFNERRATEQAIWENVLKEFSKHKDIDFAYPTQRFYNNLTEGKAAEKD